MDLKVTEFVGLLALVAAFGLITGAGFMLGAIAGMFVLAGLLTVVGTTLLFVAYRREAMAKVNGLHAVGGAARSVA